MCYTRRDEATEYEYWVSATFAPGSAPGEGSATMEVLSNVETVQHIGWSPWMAQVEEPAPGPRMLYLDKLNRMVNWSDLGIAYGQDLDVLPQADWWGVVNHENSEGVIRVSDNEITHGMKFWTWGRVTISISWPPATHRTSGRSRTASTGSCSRRR
jgi:hypothetical protein